MATIKQVGDRIESLLKLVTAANVRHFRYFEPKLITGPENHPALVAVPGPATVDNTASSHSELVVSREYTILIIAGFPAKGKASITGQEVIESILQELQIVFSERDRLELNGEAFGDVRQMQYLGDSGVTIQQGVMQTEARIRVTSFTGIIQGGSS